MFFFLNAVSSVILYFSLRVRGLFFFFREVTHRRMFLPFKMLTNLYECIGTFLLPNHELQWFDFRGRLEIS